MPMRNRTYRAVLALACQLLILAVIPARHLYTLGTGTLVTIRTAPVDPYDFLSGHYVILRYEISTPPGADSLSEGGPVYTVLRPGDDGIWSAVSISHNRPDALPPGAVFIKGRLDSRWSRTRVRYGIEAFYIPEDKRQEIEHALRNPDNRPTAQIKVDRFGHAALERLLIDGTIYEY